MILMIAKLDKFVIHMFYENNPSLGVWGEGDMKSMNLSCCI